MAKDEKAVEKDPDLEALSAASIIAALQGRVAVLEKENGELKKKHVELHQRKVGGK